jgi:hypothetical protein
MRLSARLFAQAFWLLAGLLFVLEIAVYFPMQSSSVSGTIFSRLFLATVANTFVYVAGLAGFGAIIHLLGEIRDAVMSRQS